MPLGNWPRPNFVSLTSSAGGYGNYSPGTWAIMGAYRDPLGFVHLRGLYNFTPGGSYASWIPTQLPVGYRYPGANGIFLHIGEYSGGPISFREDVQADGFIAGSQGQSVNWTGSYASMSGITYHAAWDGA